MSEITYKQYWNEVKDIANEVAADEREDKYDVLHEAIDQHMWIIYTWANLEILKHSSSCDAWFDDFGKLEAEDFSSCVQKIAFAAFMRDVQEEMGASDSEQRNPEGFDK